jgi:hypothetical protein
MPLLSWSQPNPLNPTPCLPLGSGSPIFVGSHQPCGDDGLGSGALDRWCRMTITSKHLRRPTDGIIVCLSLSRAARLMSQRII